MTGKNPPAQPGTAPEDLHKYHKYAKTIESLDALPDRERLPIINLIDEMNRMGG